MAFHVFVAMPYGIKEKINFNEIYLELIKPGLESAGFEVFRADDEIRAGNIRTDMFQELLLADLVVVDLSIDNPNVWYELGVRHALRARGVIQIQCQREYMPFDVYVDRTLRYHINDGRPDPAYLENDKKALSSLALETMRSWHLRKISPVYHLLSGLNEPNWKSLHVLGTTEFWEMYNVWSNRIELARKKNRPGDILLLADEVPTYFLRLEAFYNACKALLYLNQYQLAINHIDKALQINPKDFKSRQMKGILLGRLKKFDEAKIWLEDLVNDYPENAECLGLLGRVQKDEWINTWRKDELTIEKKLSIAISESALLKKAIKTYTNGFRKDPNNYYPGINAITLIFLLEHLTGEKDLNEECRMMIGGVKWVIQCALDRNQVDYWAKVTLGDLALLDPEKNEFEKLYKESIIDSDKNWFAIDSSLQQLLLLRELNFRPEKVNLAVNLFQDALSKLTPLKIPRFIFLFSGHMIDAASRKIPRFPATKENIAREAISKKLDALGAGTQDLALCGGACGGDLIFAEECLKRGLDLEIRIPFEEPRFVKESINFAGEIWRERFYDVKNNQKTRLFIMPDELGVTPKGLNPFNRNNLWQLYNALSWGSDKIRFICLWNLEGGDGPGGTQHMYNTVIEHSGQVYIIDTTKLF